MSSSLDLRDDVQFFHDCWRCSDAAIISALKFLVKRFKIVNALIYLRLVLKIDPESMDVRYKNFSWHFTDCPYYFFRLCGGDDDEVTVPAVTPCTCDSGFQDPAEKMQDYGYARQPNLMVVKLRNNALVDPETRVTNALTCFNNVFANNRYFGHRDDEIFWIELSEHQKLFDLEDAQNHLVSRIRHLLLVMTLRDCGRMEFKPKLNAGDGCWHLGNCSFKSEECLCEMVFNAPKNWIYNFVGRKGIVNNESSYTIIYT